MNDKKKILILRIIIVLIVLLIGFFGVVAFFDLTEKEEGGKLSTTSRRTYTTTTRMLTSEIESTSTTTTSPEVGENPTTTTTSRGANGKTTKATSTSKSNVVNTTKGTTATTKVQTTSKVIITSPVPVDPGYSPATGSSGHREALSNWEWTIADKINATRVSNGLNKLIVAEELRTVAETAAEKLTMNNTQDAKNYLAQKMISNYISVSNVGRTTDGLYTDTINAVSVATNPNIKYLGVGLLYGYENGLSVYRYCVVFE